MPRNKGWKRGAAKKGNKRATREVSRKGKYDFDLYSTDSDIFHDDIEELASLKTENSDISRDVTEELASLKTENSDIVQSCYSEKIGNLPASYLYHSQSEKSQSVQLVSHSNQREDFTSMKRIMGTFIKMIDFLAKQEGFSVHAMEHFNFLYGFHLNKITNK